MKLIHSFHYNHQLILPIAAEFHNQSNALRNIFRLVRMFGRCQFLLQSHYRFVVLQARFSHSFTLQDLRIPYWSRSFTYQEKSCSNNLQSYPKFQVLHTCYRKTTSREEQLVKLYRNSSTSKIDLRSKSSNFLTFFPGNLKFQV